MRCILHICSVHRLCTVPVYLVVAYGQGCYAIGTARNGVPVLPIKLHARAPHMHERACTYVAAARSTLQSPTWLLCITILGSAGLTYVLIYTGYTASRTFT